jgi:hypothetical protein
MICLNETRKPLRVNFGKGGMKKIVEEEDAQHVDTMHYAATTRSRVGQENLKPIETRVGFWPAVFECQKQGRIDSEDLELAGRNVKRVIGWADPVDNITSFAEVVCDNYEALVDEKRKRTTDEDGVSKRANRRRGRREEQVQPTTRRKVGETSASPSGTTQPARMEVDDFAKKRKECGAPTYR